MTNKKLPRRKDDMHLSLDFIRYKLMIDLLKKKIQVVIIVIRHKLITLLGNKMEEVIIVCG